MRRAIIGPGVAETRSKWGRATPYVYTDPEDVLWGFTVEVLRDPVPLTILAVHRQRGPASPDYVLVFKIIR